MLGAIIGDIAGSAYEYKGIKTKDFPLLRRDECCFTGDTVMTIAVADALLKGGSGDDFIDSLRRFGGLYPDPDYRGDFKAWLASSDRTPYNSFGNGSAVRVSPCAWFAESLKEAEALAKRSAAVTHNHPEGIRGAKATAAAIWLARAGYRKHKIRDYIEDKYGYDLSQTLDEIRPAHSFDETCQGTVPEAVIAFLESENFEDALRNAISLGGDSCTLVAITGSIAEAYYGLSDHMLLQAVCCIYDECAEAQTYISVIDDWLLAGRVTSIDMARFQTALDQERRLRDTPMVYGNDWKRVGGFSKPRKIKRMGLKFGVDELCKISRGLRPEAREDKWFIYFDGTTLYCHRSWTGRKIYEAVVSSSDTDYVIEGFVAESDPEIWSLKSDDEVSFKFYGLVVMGLLGWGVPQDMPWEDGSDASLINTWSEFGRMAFPDGSDRAARLNDARRRARATGDQGMGEGMGDSIRLELKYHMLELKYHKTLAESRKAIQRLCAFIPFFESLDSEKEYQCGEPNERLEDGGTILPFLGFSYSDDFQAFVKECYNSGLMVADYRLQLERRNDLKSGLMVADYCLRIVSLNDVQAYGLVEEVIHYLENADYDAVKLLLTDSIRAERFCEGTWAGGIETGLFLAILKRLNALSNERSAHMCDKNNATSTQASFKRGLGEQLKEKLRTEALFQDKLKKDVHGGKVFFAIRPGYASFYYEGRSLFKYERERFSTHQKFGFVADGLSSDYIHEDELAGLRAVQNFSDGYEEIKKRAKQYAEVERQGVSALYKFAPTQNRLDKRYFLVDIEIGFFGTDYIDILLYDNDPEEKRLLFCEAKHFTNPEIWAPDGENPKVMGQIEKYDQQIEANRANILAQYAIAFAEYNDLMGTNLHAPEKIHSKCGLLIFGFDAEERRELRARIEDKRFYGCPCRIIGNMENEDAETLYKALS